MALCPEPRSLTGGGLSGQGAVPGQPYPGGGLECQHTDFIFSAIGEELGLLGCAFTLLLLGAVVFRVIYVGLKAPDYLSRLVCLGTGAALIFQVCVNVGMCLGVAPVIGLTLPSSATAAAPSSPCIWPWVWSPASTPTPGQKPEAATSSLPYRQMFEFKAWESSLDRSGWNIYNKGEKFHF